MSKGCCTHNCRQGRDCPLRDARSTCVDQQAAPAAVTEFLLKVFGWLMGIVFSPAVMAGFIWRSLRIYFATGMVMGADAEKAIDGMIDRHNERLIETEVKKKD